MFLNSSTRLLRGCLLLNSRFTVQRNFASFLSANTSTFRPSAVVVQRRNFCIADDFESDGEKAVAKKKPQTSTEGVIMLVNEEGSVVLNDTTNEKVKHENGDAWVVLSRSRYEYTLEKLVYNLRKLCLAKERTLCLNW